MSYSSTEYTKPTSSCQACDYNTLCNYHSKGMMAPAGKGKVVTGQYVVPKYAAPGYDALTGVGTCGGYANINSAYGKGAGKCNQAYVTSLCGGCGQN